MIDKKNIICISRTTWQGDYMKAVVHIMGHLAKNHQVLFVDYAFTFKDLLRGIQGKPYIPIKRILGIEPRLRKIKYKKNKLYHLTLPPSLPINWIKNNRIFDALMRFQTWLWIKPCIKIALKRLNFIDPIMINAFHPTFGIFLQKSLDTTHTIYYCYDEISASGWGSKHGERLEDKLARSVDQIIVSSTALLTTKSQLNKNTKLIKNGVDFELFHQAFSHKLTTPRPQIGYIGSVDFRIDFDLMEQVIKSLPNCGFTFVGRIIDLEGHAKLKNLPNVKFAGAQSPEQLPAWMATMQVAIIPFVKNKFTRNIYPLKINEYLAAGLRVVSIDFADLSDFEPLIDVAKNTEGFVNAIKCSLKTPKANQKQKIAMAKNNDWATRASQFNQALSQMK